MPNYIIPHTNQFLNVKSSFVTPFNGAGDTTYTWNNVTAEILQLEENTVYFFQSIEINGTIDHNLFQDNLLVNPQLYIKSRIKNRIITPRPLAVSQYTDNRPLDFFFKNQKKNDFLDGILTGKLDQNIDLIGIDEITININFNIYAINDKIFNEAFRDSVKMSFSNKIGRG